MAVSANLFVTDSLVGSTQVKNTFANIDVGTRPLAFIGDQSFVIKLRRNSFEGDVIATTPQITIRDNAALVSFIANTYTVAEGDLVEFTLTTTGAANNAVLYYSTLDMTPNVDARDFFGANVGSFTLVDNVGKIVLQANADGSLTNETGETFKLQIRNGSITGNIVLVSDNVLILDISNVSSYFISQTSTSVVEGSNVTFTINSVNVPDGTEVFYTTAGNVRSYNFTTGNTGSRIIVNGSNTINLVTTAIPNNETRQFTLQLREGSTTGQIKATGQNVTMIDNNLVTGIQATGGTIITTPTSKLHAFTSSSNFEISSISSISDYNNIQYLIVAGGGSGANHGPGYPSAAGGGGAGGLLQGNIAITPGFIGTNSVVVGAGGAGRIVPNSTATPTRGNDGSNSSIFSLISVGGGGGGGRNSPLNEQPGNPGGSGGGSGQQGPQPNDVGTGISGQGNPGGRNTHPLSGGQPFTNGGGGGGGAGTAGEIKAFWTSLWGSNGGAGASITWVPSSYGAAGTTPGRWFAGGGGGGKIYNPGSSTGIQDGRQAWGRGGYGGGGPGYYSAPVTPIPSLFGNVNTGGGGGGFGGGGGQTGLSPDPGVGAGGSGIIFVRYNLPIQSTFALRESSISIKDGQNITFSVITTNVANNYVLYYRTSGNVTSSDFVQGNTGSFALVNNAANITLTADANIPEGETRVFTFQVLEGAVDGDVILVSNTITINPALYIEATGGTITDSGGFRTHVFTSSGTFTVTKAAPSNAPVDVLIVAGGGGGAGFVPGNSNTPGGGGAGGFRQLNTTIPSGTSPNTPYTITVGAGGGAEVSGSPSSALGFTSTGGGRGARYRDNINAAPGGSGGGGHGGPADTNTPSGAGNTPPVSPSQGNRGSNNLTPIAGALQVPGGGGAGGGAGAPGQDGGPVPAPTQNANGRSGGIGAISPLSPPSYGTPGPSPGRWFAGGGSGGSGSGSGTFPATTTTPGVAGGGGAGGWTSPANGGSGTVNTGGGGGGTAYGQPTTSTNTGGAGGSGIVIIRYPYV